MEKFIWSLIGGCFVMYLVGLLCVMSGLFEGFELIFADF